MRISDWSSDVCSSDLNADVRGLEIDPANVAAAMERGLAVVQGDANRDLADYPAGGFDYAILSQTLQTTERPDRIVDELLRIAPRAFVSFPNFAHWRVRLALMWGRSEEHPSELQSLMRISYAVFCLKKKTPSHY